MFYKNAGRSTVLDRLESHRQDRAQAPTTATASPSIIDKALLEARCRSEQQSNAKLSAFEKDMLLAWSQD